jgi:transposase-like protein
MNACDNIVALTRELGVARRLLYVWRDRFDETDPPQGGGAAGVHRRPLTGSTALTKGRKESER